MNTAEENARILLAEIEDALARGTQHYNRAGELLITPRAIVETLLSEGEVTFTPGGNAHGDHSNRD